VVTGYRSYLLWSASGQLGTGRLSSANPTEEGDGELGVVASSGTGREPTTSYATKDAADPRGPRRLTGTAAARRRASLLLPPTRHATMTTRTSSCRWLLQREGAGGAARNLCLRVQMHGGRAGCIDDV
jgi:hypothetical protein